MKKFFEEFKAFAMRGNVIDLAVGMIIGSGIFLKPSIVLNDAGSPVMALVAWVLGGIITLCSALSIAEIASNIPRAGGLYTYLEELYGEKWGFLLGWVQSAKLMAS